MLADDLGFSDLGCYGSEIDTPNLDRLAGDGPALHELPRHADVLADPGRAAHRREPAPRRRRAPSPTPTPGFPGYAMELADDVATAAEMFRDDGYATLMVGKWHLTKDSDCSAAGPKHSWPCQRGFDRYYGFLDAFTNLHHPHRLVEDNHLVEVDRYPDGYYFTDDLTDRAIAMVREHKASNPRQAVLPLLRARRGARAAARQGRTTSRSTATRYDEGWDALRERALRSASSSSA